jgi:hypothetical protein
MTRSLADRRAPVIAMMVAERLSAKLAASD